MTTTVETARAAWLAERRKGIGASEVAAILGADPRRGPLALYAEKVDAYVREDTPWLAWGRRAEGLVADVYAEESGRQVLEPVGGPYEIVRSREVPIIGATLDRVTTGSEQWPAPVTATKPADVSGPLECKMVSSFTAARWREEAPLEYQIQLQVQMFCVGARWGVLAALIGWPPRPVWVDVERNDRFLAVAIPKVEAFWHRVVNRDPPDTDSTPETSPAIRALWPADTGETITLAHDTLDLVMRWEAAKARSTSFEAEADDLGNQLRARMRDATVGLLADGTSLVLKTVSRKAYTTVHDATTYRTLRRFIPKGRGQL
jgi:putative phage-type endonuclease